MIRQSQAEVHTAASGSTVITEQLICEFVGSMQLRGCRPDSVKKYRHDLSSLYDFLPGEKRIGRNTLREWRAALAGEGYAPRTINAAVSVANSFLAQSIFAFSMGRSSRLSIVPLVSATK